MDTGFFTYSMKSEDYCKLWSLGDYGVIMRLILGKICTILISDFAGTMHVWGQGVYGKSLYLSLNFDVNLKLL